MQVRYHDTDPAAHPTPLLAIGVFQGITKPTGLLTRLDVRLDGLATRALDAGDFAGRKDEELLLYGPTDGKGPERVLLLGVGPRDKFDAEGIRRLLGRAVRAAERLGLTTISASVQGADGIDDVLLAQAATEGAMVAAWRFRELKREPGEDERPIVTVASLDLFAPGEAPALTEGVRIGSAVARGENLARTLQSRPGNVATPSHLAAEASRIAAEAGLEVTIFDEARMRVEGMEAILAVSRGSTEEARLIVLEHRGGKKEDPPLVLVGKGLTFDAGGISLKPPAGMEEMKFDMSGGAAVIGAMQAIAELDLPLHVVGVVPSSENLPSGTALKPGDIISTLAGKTVEVVNTDAEGRLILADALTYASRLNPAAVVDCATLTGAVVVGLGRVASAVLGNDDDLVEELRVAGERSGERCWPLPLWEDYRKQLDSETADLVNVGGRPAGTITAACFLSEFVGAARWAHLDIAGIAYGEGKISYHRKGGYGVPTRLLVDWVRNRAG